MRSCLTVFLLLNFILVHAQSSRKVHEKAILVDTHNDVLSSGVLDGVDISKRVKEGHSDLARWKEGGVDVQFFSVWTGDKPRTKEGFFRDAKDEIDSLNALIKRNPTAIAFAGTYKEVKKGLRANKLVALIGVEGGHMIENDLQKLEDLYAMGMRYLTLTWNNSTSWASSAMDETTTPKSPLVDGASDSIRRKGLSDFGRQVVKRMNELGVIVDLSHTGEQTFYDAIAASSKPVMLSHSLVWAICPVFRNVKDDQIKAVAKNGGVICINFYSGFISREYDERQKSLLGKAKDSAIAVLLQQHNADSLKAKAVWQTYYDSSMKAIRPSIGQLVDHIDHIVKLVGDDYVGLGSDYDGVGSLPVGLEDVTTYPKITEELMRRGYSKKSVRKILGGNVLRVMKANFK